MHYLKEIVIVRNCVSYKIRGISCNYVAQNVEWKKIVGRNVWRARPSFSAHAHLERGQDEKL